MVLDGKDDESGDEEDNEVDSVVGAVLGSVLESFVGSVGLSDDVVDEVGPISVELDDVVVKVGSVDCSVVVSDDIEDDVGSIETSLDEVSGEVDSIVDAVVVSAVGCVVVLDDTDEESGPMFVLTNMGVEVDSVVSEFEDVSGKLDDVVVLEDEDDKGGSVVESVVDSVVGSVDPVAVSDSTDEELGSAVVLEDVDDEIDSVVEKVVSSDESYHPRKQLIFYYRSKWRLLTLQQGMKKPSWPCRFP
ncbi:hypothetical protein SCAR479_10740 [Seiridium cardinale]|uniref:Uncharacterized protein n=1 Tax=Seiridium cardinale TaxID=138064 RepID=A0ABR2XFE1_9PEZI